MDFTTYLGLAASTTGFARAWVEGPAAPMLRATKTHRTDRVAIDDATIRQLTEYRRRVDARATANELVLAEPAFVFSADRDGSTPWLRNRVTKPFPGHPRHIGVGRFRLHDLQRFITAMP